MKFRFLGLMGLGLVVCLAPAIQAQDEQRQRGRQRGGQRGGPGGGPGGFGRGGGFQVGGALELMGLLRMPEVREEVNMEDEVYEALREGQPDMRAMFQAEPEERAEMMKEAGQKAQEMLDEVLEPDQLKRLMGLLIQQNGMRAASNDMIAKEIGLDEAGIKKVREAAVSAMEGMREKMREMFAGGGGPGGFDREKMQSMMEDARKETDKQIGEALTSDQKKKLEDMKGEKFEFPERGGRGGFGGRGGRPGGAGGAGGRGGRPGGAGGRGGRPGAGTSRWRRK